MEILITIENVCVGFFSRILSKNATKDEMIFLKNSTVNKSFTNFTASDNYYLKILRFVEFPPKFGLGVSKKK